MSRPADRLRQADRVGFAASMLCAIHCAAMPLLLAILPTLGLGAGGWVDLDQAVVVFATLLAAGTLTIGWRRHRAYPQGRQMGPRPQRLPLLEAHVRAVLGASGRRHP